MNTGNFQVQFFLIGLLGITFSLISIFLSKRRNKIDLFSPPIFVLLVLVAQYYLPAFFIPYKNYFVYPNNGDFNKTIFFPILLTTLAWLFFVIGYSLKLGQNFAYSLPVPSKSKFFFKTGIFMLIIGFLLSLIVIIKSGGLSIISKEGSVKQGTGIFVILSQVTLPGMLICWIKPSTRILAFSVCIIYTILLFVSQARGVAVITILLIFISSYYLWNIKNKITLMFFGIGIVFVTLTGSLGRVLRSVENLEDVIFFLTTFINSLIDYIIFTINRDVSKLNQLSIIMEYFPDKIDFFWMQTFLMSLLGPFRKYLFPEYVEWRKLVTAMAFNLDPETVSWSFGGTSVGEWYINLGVIGVAIGWLFFGLLGKILYEWFLINYQKNSQLFIIPIYVIFMKIYIGIISEGFNHFFNVWLLVIPILSLKWIKKKKILITLNS